LEHSRNEAGEQENLPPGSQRHLSSIPPKDRRNEPTASSGLPQPPAEKIERHQSRVNLARTFNIAADPDPPADGGGSVSQTPRDPEIRDDALGARDQNRERSRFITVA
jgi:hypothetical protein